MSRNLARPYFPIPPAQYDQQYMYELTRAFSVYIDQQANPGVGRFTNVTLTDLPTSATGLEPGTLYNDAGTVKVAT